jgi:hypothetical protein
VIPISSFFDELEKISEKKRFSFAEKAFQRTNKSSVVSDEVEKIALWSQVAQAGQRVAGAVRSAPQRVVQGFSGMGQNLGNAAATILRPSKAAWRHGFDASFRPERLPGGKPMGRGMKAFMGLSLGMGAYQAAKKEDPTGRGQSRFRRITRLAGEQAGGVLTAPFGFSGGMLGATVGGKLGDVVGAAGERLVGHRPQPHLPPPPVGQQG